MKENPILLPADAIYNRLSGVIRLSILAILCFAYGQGLRAQTTVNFSGMQRPVFTSVSATTGGSLSNGTYYYIVIATDAAGGQSSYTRGYDVAVSGTNSAVNLAWSSVTYATSYKIYRSLAAFGGSWYLLTTTSATSYTDNGSAGTLAVPPLAQTNIGLKGNTGLDISDETGASVIKLINYTGSYANYPAVQIGSYFQMGGTGIYGANSGLLRSYQGIRFEPMEPTLQNEYSFWGMQNEYGCIYLQPRNQRMFFIDQGSSIRSDLNQGVADGTNAIAFKLSSYNTLSNPGAKLLSVINSSNEMFAIMASGEVRAKKIKVTSTGWSDYVFDNDYILKPLSEVERYIQNNKHLPEVPSAKSVSENGIDLGDNQALLLKKIEELTLHMIRLDKENRQMKQARKT